jgi:hypothetical protein
MRISLILALLTLTFGLLGTCNVTLAQTTSSSSADQLIKNVPNPGSVDLGESLIHPASPLYFLKAIREKVEVLLGGSSETKSMRQVEFAQRRLREVSSLVKAKRQDLIPATIEEYKAHLKNAEDFAMGNEELQVTVGEATSRHLEVLQRVYDMVGNPNAKAAIRGAIERAGEQNTALLENLSTENQQKLIRKTAQREAFACKFLMREATSAGLNDTEKLSLGQRVNKCRQDIVKHLKDELEEARQNRL